MAHPDDETYLSGGVMLAGLFHEMAAVWSVFDDVKEPSGRAGVTLDRFPATWWNGMERFTGTWFHNLSLQGVSNSVMPQPGSAKA